MKLVNLVIGYAGNWVIGGGARCAGALARTAVGPRIDTMLAASGSVLLRHSQPGFFFAGWCIGHSSWPVLVHVHVIASAAPGACARSDSGATVSSDN